jgi:putative phosphoribosyl transferase
MTQDTMVRVPTAGTVLDADLVVPRNPVGVVVFAHGSGSSRHSPRNRMVAARLHEARMVTVLADLLTLAEERIDDRTGRLRFDIELLSGRVAGAVDWVREQPETEGLPVGLFGASTGAAAALRAAAVRPEAVRAVVSRGGRPDLAGDALWHVRAPTLLIVGGRDTDVVDLNEQAAGALSGHNEVRVVPGATHLFPERGALEQVAAWASEWFSTNLRGENIRGEDIR